MRRTFLRRRYIVDWKLQGSLCLHGLLYGLLLLVTISGGIFVPLLWDLGDRNGAVGFEEQAIVMLYMHERFWVLALACAVIVVFGAIRFSHRIAGPLVRYKRNLRWLAAGRMPNALRTRDGDYLQEEVACLNAAVAGVGERVDAIRKAQRELRRELEALGAVVPAVALQGLRSASQDLEQSLDAFRPIDAGDELVALPAGDPALACPGEGRP